MDEIQRVPAETFLGLAMQTPTLCAFGDKAQKVTNHNNLSFRAAGENGLYQRQHPGRRLAWAPRLQSTICSGPCLARPAPIPDLKVHELTQTKRFGEPPGDLPGSTCSRSSVVS